jgi:hypothetical protein
MPGEESVPSEVEGHTLKIKTPTKSARLLFAFDDHRIGCLCEMKGCAQPSRPCAHNDDRT